MSETADPAKPLGDFSRFGVLGGSFNPVHVGHISIAQQVLNGLKLQRVFLMPAAQPPHKQRDAELASADDRLAMCRLAVENMHGLDASDFELARGGVSYTIETAKALRAAYGRAAEIRFIIGSDSLLELPTWKEAPELVRLADFAVADRREAPIGEEIWEKVRAELGEEAEAKLRASVVPIERVDVSATAIRKLLKEGAKIPGYLRRDVEAYIRKKRLYGV